MPCLASYQVRYAPPPSPRPPAVAIGRAFRRLWREPSPLARTEMRRALMMLARCLHETRTPPEKAVLAFKNAVFCYGGVRSFPSLAADHHTDGQACADTYASAFSDFVLVFFGTSGMAAVSR